MRLLFALVALFFLGTFAPLRLQRPEPVPAVSIVTAKAIEPKDRTLGRLAFLEGWELESDDFRFGGISALHVEGSEVLAFSDGGYTIRFPLPDGREAPADIRPAPKGTDSPAVKEQRDVEAAAVLGPLAWLAFERANEVWRYDRQTWRSQAGSAPAAMAQWPLNSGSEAMLRLPDGRFLVFAESDGETSEAILFDGDPAVDGTRWSKLLYRPPTGYVITDAALLPDGAMLFLNRKVDLGGFSVKLTLAQPAPLAEGATIAGEEIATLEGLDNLEGISLTHEGGRTIVWLASDDNYGPLQRTLLLKFALAD